MNFTPEFWVQIALYALTIGTIYGGIKSQLKSLEEKVNRHNGVIERTFRIEESLKSAHHRIDEIKKELI